MVSPPGTFKNQNSLEIWHAGSSYRETPVPDPAVWEQTDLWTLLRLHTGAEGIVHIHLFAESRALNVTFLGAKVKAL